MAESFVHAGVDPGARPIAFNRFSDSPLAQDELVGAVAAQITRARELAVEIVSRHRAAIETFARSRAEARDLSGAELAAAFIGAGIARGQAPAGLDGVLAGS